MKRIAIITGEPSGDVLGGALMHDLKQMGDFTFAGIGDRAMAAEGLKSILPIEKLAIMGVSEVLPKIPELLKLIRETADFVIAGEFDALITIDAPDFVHRVSRRVRRAQPDIPIIHYVAPSVWAWRPKRAQKIAHFVDHVLCLLPFEPPLMTQAGMSADFVGHPAADAPRPDAMNAWREINGDVLAVFPGSRGGEIARHAEAMASAILAADLPAKVMIPTLDHLADDVRAVFPMAEVFSPADYGQNEFNREKSRLMHGAGLALATSGTVSFELSFANCPTIVGYDASRMNRMIARRFIKTKYASLTNILLDDEIIPEFLFEAFSVENLTHALSHSWGYDAFMRDQREGFGKMRKMMMPNQTAAQSVMAFLEKREN